MDTIITKRRDFAIFAFDFGCKIGDMDKKIRDVIGQSVRIFN